MATVLIVDDNKGYGRFLMDFMKRLGYESFLVTQGDEALKFVKSTRTDLILLDWCLPVGISGEKTLRTLKSLAASKTIPVIVLSGLKDSPEDEVQALGAGAALFISKKELSDSIPDGGFQRHVHALIRGHRQAPASSARSPIVKGDSTAQGHGRVLIVEDDPEINLLIVHWLREGGYTSLSATCGQDALLKARQQQPDMILLDLTLPDMDGFHVCDQLKTQQSTAHIPIMVLTGHSSDLIRKQALEHQVDHFLVKPIEKPEDLLGWISALMKRRSLQTESRTVVRVGDILLVDLATQTVNVGERTIPKMPKTLFRLLREFVEKPGELLSRDYLVSRVWTAPRRHRIVDLNVMRLRDHLGDPVRHWFVPVPGKGYSLIPGMPPRDDDARGR